MKRAKRDVEVFTAKRLDKIQYDEMFGSVQSQASSDTAELKTYYQVQTIQENAPEFDVLRAEGIPARGEKHPTANVYCTKRSGQLVPDSRVLWAVVVDWNSPDPGSAESIDPDSAGLPPWEQPAKATYTSIDLGQAALEKAYGVKRPDDTEEFTPDNENKPTIDVINAAYQPFDPPVPYDEGALQITITESRRSFDLANIMRYSKTVNKEELRVAAIDIPAMCGFIVSISVEPATYTDEEGDSYTYYQLGFVLRVINSREWGWGIKVANRGTKILGPSGTTFYDIILDPIPGETKGRTAQEPVWLTKDGKDFIRPDQKSEYNHFIYYPHRILDWKGLSLPKKVNE